ncbi:MAG: ABC transporter ATP-binding protein [Deltaproteobacteria bacterium]|nr:ABC transporter ATP-binding protein [Deltaproteobacteria bacterium]
MTLLEVKNLKTEFRTRDGTVRAVDGVSFSLGSGESLGIVGESGSGKSVTLLSVMGLVPSPPGEVTDGSAVFEGEDLLKMPAEKLRSIRGRRLAMIFQDPMTSLNPFLTIGRQMTEVLEVHEKLSRKEAAQQSCDMLSRVGIPDVGRCVDCYPHQFSGGMRQRVMIAMALLCKPSLLIADEPTTALDVTIQAQILDLLFHMQKDRGMGLILITHNLGVVAGICERLIVMYAGRVAEEGTTEQIFSRPRHPYTQALLRSLPRLDRRRETLATIPDQPPDLSRLPSGCPFHPRCHLADAKCREQGPPLQDRGDRHRSACWKAEEL